MTTDWINLPEQRDGGRVLPEHVIQLQDALGPAEQELADHETRVTAAEETQVGQERGLVAPNPGALARLKVPRPLTVDEAPTFTAGVSAAASVITGGVIQGPLSGSSMDSAPWTYYGCPVGEDLINFNRWSTGKATSGTLLQQGPWYIEFEWYGSEFELVTYGSATSRIRMWVDDLGYDAWDGVTHGMANNGAIYRHHYEFADARIRRIKFDFNSSVVLGGITIGPNDTIWKTAAPTGPKVVVTGDSFSESDFIHWPVTMGLLLGWKNVHIVGKGSTGYLDTNEGGDTFRQRAQKDIYNQSPEIVVVSGGINDSQNTDYAAVQTEAGAFYAEIKENLPNCILVVSGMQWPSGSPNQQQLKVGFAIRDAALGTSAVDCYIDQLGLGTGAYSGSASDYVNQGWITGTGKVGSTTGSGNADLFTSADGTHPSQAGYDYRGWRHASALVAQMPIGGA